MELLQFVFSSFWVWLGCVVLIVAAGEAVATAAAGFRQKRKVSVYHVGDVKWRTRAAPTFRRR